MAMIFRAAQVSWLAIQIAFLVTGFPAAAVTLQFSLGDSRPAVGDLRLGGGLGPSSRASLHC
ncbi:hypothetical protein DIZ27_36770 [Streptomyces sp. NWU339]|nr:hypothetical protein DIZ27_36770 [Streptomyces sp. NWU339]